MISIPTQHYIESQLADIKAAIMEQQRESGGCESYLRAALNALASFLKRSIAREEGRDVQSLPPLPYPPRGDGWLSPQEALRYHDRLLALVHAPAGSNLESPRSPNCAATSSTKVAGDSRPQRARDRPTWSDTKKSSP